MSADAFAVSGLDLPGVRALFERLARTSLGRRAVRELEPRDEDGARAALGRAGEMAALERAGDTPSFGGVSDPVPPLAEARAHGRPLEAPQLASLAAFIGSALRLAAWLSVRAGDAPRLGELARGVPSELTALSTRLAELLDEGGEVRDDATPRLARLRGEARELERALSATVERIAARPEVRAVLTDHAVHRRAGRWVLAVRARSSGRVKGVIHDRSQSGETAFVEPREAVELSNRRTEVLADERAELGRILVEITREVLASEELVARAAAAVAELELALGAADFCREYGARVPAVAEDLVLRSARHPLLVEELRQERLEQVVPIDVRLGGDFDLLVVTGPNTGGKTLALKTIGVAAWSVRMGWPVCCAEGSSVPLYDGIVADIGDEQEIRQSLSTFASHLVRIRDGLARSTPRTLVLLDELGGGTDPDEGAALGHAILEHLLERGVPTLVTTHLGRLKEFCFRNARAENASVEFDAASLMPLFRLRIGTPGESNALAIAQRLGVDRELLARAEERIERRDREVAELIAEVRGTREHAELLRSEAEDRVQELDHARHEFRAREAELQRRGEQLEAEAQLGLEERVREARRRLASARGLLEQLPGAVARELEEALEQADRDLSGASLTDRREAFLKSIKKGELVFIPRFKKRCLVTRVNKARREVTVLLGKMKMTVGFDEVTYYEAL